MIIKITNKRIILFTVIISALAGVFTVFARYDCSINNIVYNNFLFLHDDDISSVGFHTLISIMNVILLFPFAMEMLTNHKTTNEIYIVSRMINSVRFYYVKFFQVLILCFIENLCYNTVIIVSYCCLGKIAEPFNQLVDIYIYTVIVNFLIVLTFNAIMQAISVVINEKVALLTIIVLFCFCVIVGIKNTRNYIEMCITNYYFVSLTFTADFLSSKRIMFSLALPLIITIIVSTCGSIIYKCSDHM